MPIGSSRDTIPGSFEGVAGEWRRRGVVAPPKGGRPNRRLLRLFSCHGDVREGRTGAVRPKPGAHNGDSAGVPMTFRWTAPFRPPVRARDPLDAPWRDHDPSRVVVGHGNGDFGRVHRATTRSCLIALPSFLLSIASSFLRAGFDAVDLASIAPPTDQDLRAAASTPKHPARSFINTCGRACPARRIILLAAPSKRLANAHATNSAARPSILGARMAGRVERLDAPRPTSAKGHTARKPRFLAPST